MTIKDGDWSLVEWDAVTGRTVWVMFDGEKTVVRTDYPIEATVAENQSLRNSADKAWRGDWHRIASIPLNIYHEQLAAAEQQGDKAFISRWLNDSDNRAWRTRDGRV